MKICLINPPFEESLDPKLDPPLGLVYIATVLRNLGHDVSVLDLSFHDKEDWEKVIPTADLYGITVMTMSIHHAINIKNIVRKINPECKVMVGGAHPSNLPEETLRMGFDIVVVGEGDGEDILKEIIEYVYMCTKHMCTEPKIFIARDVDINSVPIPYRDLIPIRNYTRLVEGVQAFSLFASRGCPYSCAFCLNSTRKINKARFRTVGSILEEMKLMIKKYDAKAFMLYDDTFTAHPKLNLLLEEIQKLNVIFRCSGDVRMDKLEKFQKLYDAGCEEISFGIETGSQKILDLVNKRATVEQNRIAITDAKKAGLRVKAFLMVGSPGESWETIKETVKFMWEVRPNLWTLFTFVPLPGCDIWINPDKYGIKIITKDYKQFFNIAGQNIGGMTIDTEFMSALEIAKAREYLLKNLPPLEGHLQAYQEK